MNFRPSRFCQSVLPLLTALFSALFLPVTAKASDSFTATGAMGTARSGHTATLLQNGKVLVAGGYTRDAEKWITGVAELYDPATGSWEAAGVMVKSRAKHTATLLADGRVLVTGGVTASGWAREAEIYDPATGAWSRTGALAHGRDTHTATPLLDGGVLVAGGFGQVNGLNTWHDTVEIYDPATGLWKTAASMTSGRQSHTATRLANGRVLVAGGARSSYDTLFSVEIFDPATGLWSAGGVLNISRRDHTATLLADGKVLVAAGYGVTDLQHGHYESKYLDSAELYDPASNSWSVTGSLATARRFHSATLLPDGKVLVSPGNREPGQAPSAEVYNPATATWTVAAQPVADRSEHTATLLPGGGVLLTGGFVSNASGDRQYLNSTEIYSYGTPVRTPTGYMVTDVIFGIGHLSKEKHGYSTTLLPNGKVLIAGGATLGSTAINTAEIYDPASGTWTATGLLNARRMSHRATLLPNGKVLVTGGVDNTRGFNPTNYDIGAEIYDPATGVWTKTAPPLESREGHTTTLLPDGKVFVTGGANGYRTLLSSTEIYDPATGAWSAGSPMIKGISSHTATLLPDGRVLVTGGHSSVEIHSLERTAYLYNPRTGAWSRAESMPEPRMGHSATLLPDGRVLISGGIIGAGSPYLYDPVTDSWSVINALPVELITASPVLMRDGRLFVTGAAYPSITLEKSAFYDPATGLWEEFSTGGVASYPLDVLPDGKVLLSTEATNTAGMSLFDVGLGFPEGRRPVITSAFFDSNGRLAVSGTGFRGFSGGSVGNTADSPTDYPIVQLRRLDNGQTLALPVDPAAGWTDTSFTSLPLTGFPRGHAMVTVFVNGIPSVSSIILVPAPELRVERAGTGAELANGAAAEFGNVKPGESTELFFVVKNTGALALSGLTVTFSGTNAALFTLAAAPAASVPGPDGSTSFTVRFSPNAPGAKTAALHLASTDADENPFTILLSGVGTNTAPVITGIADRVVDEDGQVSLSFTVTDAETPGVFTLSAVSSNPALIGPSGIVFSGTGSSRTAVLSPNPNQSGSAVITVTMDDGAMAGDARFTLTVNPVNDPPTLDAIPAEVIVLEDAGPQIVNLTGLGAGPGENGQPFTVTAASSNPALIPHPPVSHAAGAAEGSLTCAPAPNASGEAVITVTVNDGQGQNGVFSRSFTVTVLPVNDPPTLDAIANPAPVLEDSGVQTVALSGIGAGPGEAGQSLTVTAVSSNPRIIPHPVVSHVSPAATGTLSFTPAPDAHGTATVTVTVSDGQSVNPIVSRSFSVTVTPVNDPPTLAAIAAPAPLREGAGVQRVNFSGVSAGTGDAEAVTVSAVSSNPALIPHPSVFHEAFDFTGYLEFTPAAGQSGMAEITVTVDDGQGGPESTFSRSFSVRVMPFLRAEAASVTEGNEGVAPLRFRLFISGTQPEEVRMNWTTRAGTAQEGSDFTAASGTAVIPAGETETFVEVTVKGDAEFEADETLALVLTGLTGALTQSPSFTGTIQNDDAQPALVLTPGSVTEAETGGPFLAWVKAALPAPSDLPLSWTVRTRAGSALPNEDFTPLGPLSLTFAPGETVKWVAVRITGAEASEADEEEFHLDFAPHAGPASTAGVPCVIRQLAVRDFIPLGEGVYALRFPTGTGQSYVIEEAESLQGPWTSSSSRLLGTGSTVTQVVFSDKSRVFFRVNAAPEAPGPAAVGP